MSVFIVVLFWNQKEVTRACLRSLTRLTYPCSIVCVDNNSTDGSLGDLSKEFPQFVFLSNSDNIGFAAGNNTGVRYAIEHGADIVIFLNNDTEVDSHFVEPLVAALDDPKVGMVSSFITRFQDQSEWFSGGRILWPFMRIDHVAGATDFLSGCCVAVRCDVIGCVGFLDERFFLYGEDVDYSLRIRKAGFLLKVIPESKVAHKVSVTVGEKSPRSLYYTVRNNLILISKHVSFWFQPFGYFYVFLLSLKIIFNHHNLVVTDRVGVAWRDFFTGRLGKMT